MDSFRFIHTADIHLDSPLKGLAGYAGPVAERIRTATRQAFEVLITEAIQLDVAFLVIAGDVYDGDWRDYQTGLFFARQMGRADAAGIPAFVLHGNHDAESQITKRLSLPGGVKTFPARKAETFVLPDPKVALHGQSFQQREVTDNLVPGYPEPLPGFFNIGVLHTGLGGLGGHENYAPCGLEELAAKGYNYWALGHVHRAAVLHEHPHIVFPGNLQGRHIREDGPKGAYLVSIEEGQVVDLSPLETGAVRWARLAVEVQDGLRATDAVELVRRALEEAIQNRDGCLLACRIELTGQTGLHADLIDSQDYLLAEARALALGFGDDSAWIERVIVATEPLTGPAAAGARDDALGDLQRMLEDAPDDAELLDELKAQIDDCVRRLPPDVRNETGDDLVKAALQSDYRGLVRDACTYLRARLAARQE